MWARSAAQRYLGPLFTSMVDEVGANWKQHFEEHWAQQHQQSGAGKDRFDELTAKEQLDDEERFEHAALTERFDSADAALPLYRQLMEKQPGHASATYACGRILLGKNDPEAIPLLQQFEAEEAAQQAERNQLNEEDTLLPPELGAAREPLRRLILSNGKISKAWIARKHVIHFHEVPAFVILVKFKAMLDPHGTHQQGILQEIADGATDPRSRDVATAWFTAWLTLAIGAPTLTCSDASNAPDADRGCR